MFLLSLGMSGPICEWGVSALSVRYVFLLSLSARVDPSVRGCICLKCALYVLVVTLGMSGPICEWAVSASSVRYMFLLSLSA